MSLRVSDRVSSGKLLASLKNGVGQHQGDVHMAEDIGRRELILLVLAAVFVWVNALALSLALDGRLQWWHFSAPAAWLVMLAAAHLVLRIFRPLHDPFLLPIVGLLTGWGFILLGRLAPGFLGRQVLWLALGMAVMAGVALWPYNLRFLRRYR
jgi:hypothetical protein